MSEQAVPAQRVAPILIPESWELPGKPEGAPATIQDAYRQSQFQLGPDLRLLAEGMRLQIAVMRDSYPSRYRTHRLAAASMHWSRVFLAISDSCLLLTRGSYASCPALVRLACEAIAACYQASGEAQQSFLDWLNDSLQPNEGLRAIEIGLGSFAAGSTLESRETLAGIFVASSEFARQHFGVTLIEVAPESNRQKLGVTFGDQSFHFGWAQLILGWLLALGLVQLEVVLSEASPFHVSDETRQRIGALSRQTVAALAAPQRCRVETIQAADGTGRLLIHNFRRQSAGAPIKLLL